MKYQYIKLLLIELFLIAFSFFHFFFVKQMNHIYYAIELLLILTVLIFINKLDKKENYQKKDVTLVIIISILAYYVITYLVGFFIGFVYTTYSRSIMGMTRNVVLSTMVILIIELIREILIQKGRYYKSIVFLSFIVTTILELIFLVSVLNFSNKRNILEISMMIVSPCLFRNIFLTYCTYYFGRNNSIIYHILMVVVPYILPVFPNLGDYVNSILVIIHPLILLMYTSDSIFYKQDKIDDTYKYKRYEKIGKYVYSCFIVFLAILIYLVSDLGRFTLLAIGSESMKGSINKGDIILIDKKHKDYKKGDIIVYEYNNSLLVHRIVDVREDHTFITKGDNNNGIDSWIVKDSMIKGITNFRIKYLGWPTVQLSEYLNKDD